MGREPENLERTMGISERGYYPAPQPSDEVYNARVTGLVPLPDPWPDPYLGTEYTPATGGTCVLLDYRSTDVGGAAGSINSMGGGTLWDPYLTSCLMVGDVIQVRYNPSEDKYEPAGSFGLLRLCGTDNDMEYGDTDSGVVVGGDGTSIQIEWKYIDVIKAVTLPAESYVWALLNPGTGVWRIVSAPYTE